MVNQLELIRARKESVRIYTPKMKDMGWQISKKYVFFIMINSKNTFLDPKSIISVLLVA